jgi:hypothetical protein
MRLDTALSHTFTTVLTVYASLLPWPVLLDHTLTPNPIKIFKAKDEIYLSGATKNKTFTEATPRQVANGG